MDDAVVIGHVATVHPAQRRLRIVPVGSRRGEFVSLEWLHLRTGGKTQRMKVASVARLAGYEQVELTPVVSRDVVATLKRALVVIPSAEALPRSRTEYDLAELKGLQVFSGNSRLGRVEAVMDTKAGGVLELTAADGRSLLVPVTDSIVQDVDWDAGRIVLGELDGLAVDAEMRT